jgi:hypothetical protein
MDSTLMGLGVSDVADLEPGMLVIPPGFERALGA